MADGEVPDRSDSDALPPVPVSGGDSETLGQALRRARRQRGLTIQQIAATTRIPARHLEALERDDLQAVPGGLYLRNDVRAYADAVGLSRSVALAYLHAATDPPVVAAVVAQATTASGSRRAVRWGALIGGICLVLAAIVMWGPNRDRGATAPTPPVSEGRTAPGQPAPASGTAGGAGARTHDVPLAVDTSRSSAVSGTTGSAHALDSATDVAADYPPSTPVDEPELEIVSEPAGARVTVDGVGWGVTPVTIRYLPPGNKQLRVTKDGFAAEERLIRVSTQEPRILVRIELHEIK